MKRKLNYLLFTILVLSSCMCYSQSAKNPPHPKEQGPPHPELPIDGGVTFLIIIGAAFGVYKLKEK